MGPVVDAERARRRRVGCLLAVVVLLLFALPIAWKLIQRELAR